MTKERRSDLEEGQSVLLSYFAAPSKRDALNYDSLEHLRIYIRCPRTSTGKGSLKGRLGDFIRYVGYRAECRRVHPSAAHVMSEPDQRLPLPPVPPVPVVPGPVPLVFILPVELLATAGNPVLCVVTPPPGACAGAELDSPGVPRTAAGGLASEAFGGSPPPPAPPPYANARGLLANSAAVVVSIINFFIRHSLPLPQWSP